MSEAVAEQLPSPESERPSNRLILHVIHGQHDANESLPDQLPDKVSEKSLIALRNQNKAIRQKDEERFEDRIKQSLLAEGKKEEEITPEMIRENHLNMWGKLAFLDMVNDVNTRQGKIASIFSDKLGIPIKGGMTSDAILGLEKYFYDSQTQTEGAFYKKFCGEDMNEALAEALTTEDMMLLKSFLTNWMVGTDTAFDGLFALRLAKDILADEIKRTQLTNSNPLSERDKKTLAFYHNGITLEEQKRQSPQAISKSEEALQPEPQAQEHLTTRIGSATEKHPKHPDRNDDTFFLDPEKQQGGIFDGAGGYANGDLASKIARDAMQEVLTKLPFPVQEKQAIDALSDALRLADERIKASGQQGKTTAAAFQIVENPDGSKTLWAVNVGDSRIWIRHSNGTVSQVTQDGGHLRDWYREQFDNATSDEERKAATDDYNNAVKQLNNAQSQTDIANQLLGALWTRRNETNLLGSGKPLDEIAELIKEPLREGDTIFMTTDGVHDNLTTEQIAELAKETADPQTFAEHLVARAKEVSDNNTFRSKHDDITAVAVHLETKLATQQKNQEDDQERLPTQIETLMEKLRSPGIRRLGKEITFTEDELKQIQTLTKETGDLLVKNAELQNLLQTIQHYANIDAGFAIAKGFGGTGIVENSYISTPRVVPGETAEQPMRIEIPPQLFTLYDAYNHTNTALSLLQRYQDSLTTGGTGTLGSFFAKNLEKILEGYRQLKKPV